MRKIILGLVQTPALLVGIVLLLITLPLDVIMVKNYLAGNQLQNEMIGQAYQTILLMFILAPGGVFVKREFVRIFIRGEK